MARPRMSQARQQAAATQASRRMISRGERPMYRLAHSSDGSWTADGLAGVTAFAEDRRAASEAMGTAIATLLEVPPDSFDLE